MERLLSRCNIESVPNIVVKFEDEKLYHHDIEVGTVSFSLVVSYVTYLR